MEVKDSPKEGSISRSSVTLEGDLVVPYLKVGEGGQYPSLTLHVSDPSDEDEIRKGVQQELLSEFWFLDKNIRREQLIGRYGVVLGDGVEVDVYNFQKGFDKQKLGLVAGTLARFFNSLKDKNLWNLESVQIRSGDTMNRKSGEPFRGLEHPRQKRFELFPASFAQGIYRNTLACTWAEGATVHETTHVVLESYLASLWNNPDLGWEYLHNLLLVLPGGYESRHYNRNYPNLPTDYAAYQPDDDRAESVVAYLFDPGRLNEPRRRIMSEVFTPVPSTPFFEIVEKDPRLPELPDITVEVQPQALFFSRMGIVTYHPEQKDSILSLEEYRKIRGLS